ncbi:MAG: hypothetical protein JWO56_1234 [Acidobacteria bacterium]|nr:hypothetical protein [Acidobacteriota bacterium]
MKMVHAARILCLIALIVSSVSVMKAQEIRVGGLEGNGQVFIGPSAATLIDWNRPAGSSGSVNTASVAWTDANSPCDNIFYVRFYAIPSNALVTVMTAERGPFRAVNGINTVALDPPVSVGSETFIGIRRADGPSTCGQPYGTFTREAGRSLFISGDFKNGPLTLLSPAANFRLQAQASSVPSVRVATLPGVASAAGSFGSFFRTSLTLSNPGSLEIRGKLRFRAAGRAGSDADPTMDFVIPRNATVSYADVLATMNQTGLGSLDILTTASPTPVVSARVFNDAGSNGTSGFSEEAVPAGDDYLSVAHILIPADAANYRLNVGIRTFTAGDLGITVYDAAGVQQTSLTRTYAADYFEQISASAFLNGAPLPPGGRITVSAYNKQFIVYGAVTDNRTNDPSMRIGSD